MMLASELIKKAKEAGIEPLSTVKIGSHYREASDVSAYCWKHGFSKPIIMAEWIESIISQGGDSIRDGSAGNVAKRTYYRNYYDKSALVDAGIWSAALS